jgi:hypothetical protein
VGVALVELAGAVAPPLTLVAPVATLLATELANVELPAVTELAGAALELPAEDEGSVPTGTMLPPCTLLSASEEVVMAAAAM